LLIWSILEVPYILRMWTIRESLASTWLISAFGTNVVAKATPK